MRLSDISRVYQRHISFTGQQSLDGFAEPLGQDDLPLPEEFYDIVHIRIIRKPPVRPSPLPVLSLPSNIKMSVTALDAVPREYEDASLALGATRELLEPRPDEKFPKIREMAKAAQRMVTEAVDAYVRQDLELAHAVMKHDDIVDDYFNRVKAGIIRIIAENPTEGEYALDLLMIAKYFERIGDHCINIAEWVEFSVTGAHRDCQ